MVLQRCHESFWQEVGCGTVGKLSRQVKEIVCLKKRIAIMEYSAGQELIDILLHFGFKEDTDKIYPDQYEQMKQRGEYNPYSFKRSFKKGRMWVLFDYINIHILYNSSTFFFNSMGISLEELTSLIYFMQLTSADKSYMLDKLRGDKITDLYHLLIDTDACHYSRSTLNKLNRHKQEMMYIKAKILNYKNL